MITNPKINFVQLDSVNNPSSMHGIYPYRGKISAIDARSIIEQLPKDGVLLDPFCGSGTIVYEAQKHGLNAFGIDNNPLAIQLSKAKVYRETGNSFEEAKEFIERAKQKLTENNYQQMPEAPLSNFHSDTANEIMCLKEFYDEMNDFLKGIFLGTIALAARGCNNYVWTSSTVGKNIEPKRYIDFFDKYLSKTKKHSKYLNSLDCKPATIIKGDSRILSTLLEKKSINYVFTSPPYFDGLDYTAYYGKIIYEIFSADRQEIKKDLIQYVDTYRDDMAKVLSELNTVMKDTSLSIFVVGDKKLNGKIVNGGDFFADIQPASYIAERSYSKTSSKVFDVLNKTDRKEQIVVWDKVKGELINYER